MKHSLRAQRRCGTVFGTILLAGGLVWLGVKFGLIPSGIIQSIPFIPLVMIFLGAWMLISSLMRKPGNNGNCCQ